MARRGRSAAAATVVIIGLVVVVLIGVLTYHRMTTKRPPIPGAQRCVATASGRSVELDTEQAANASIIAAVSVRRGLVPRAASIALTTAYQESGIRNLDHGDRDSVGLFQQRPSKGWGPKKKLLNPYYATNRFYDALIKIDGWEHDDITEIAQKIQVSGYPDAYKDHESDGRILASVLTGQSPAGLQCLIHDQLPGDGAGLVKALHKAYAIKPKRSGTVITVSASSSALAWSYAQFALANARDRGIHTVQVGTKQYTVSNLTLTSWRKAAQPVGAHTVKITVR